MMGLLRPPAVMRLLSCASTPVRSTTAVGQYAERVSRSTCCEARAVSLPTVIRGLFFTARASASFRVKRTGGALGSEACGFAWAAADIVIRSGRRTTRDRRRLTRSPPAPGLALPFMEHQVSRRHQVNRY